MEISATPLADSRVIHMHLCFCIGTVYKNASEYAIPAVPKLSHPWSPFFK